MPFNLIEQCHIYAERIETPTSFLDWGFKVLVAAALRDRIYFRVPNRATRIYPNIYVLLIGPSAVTRKDNPFHLCSLLLRRLGNTKIFDSKLSMPALIKLLADSESNGPKGGSCALIAGELGAFFVRDETLIADLTDLYNWKAVYEKFVVSYEIAPIKDLCLTFFAGTNEVMMKSLIDTTAREGGLLGRSFVLIEKTRRFADSGYTPGVKYSTDEDWFSLIPCLKRLDALRGEVTWEPDALVEYDRWYKNFPLEKMPAITGYEGRIQSHVQKLCMIDAASEYAISPLTTKFTYKIRLDTLNRAIKECEELIATYTRITKGSGESPDALPLQLFLDSVMTARDHKITKSEILTKHLGNMTLSQLDEIVSRMLQANLIVHESINNEIGYSATEKLRREMNPNSNHHKRGV